MAVRYVTEAEHRQILGQPLGDFIREHPEEWARLVAEAEEENAKPLAEIWPNGLFPDCLATTYIVRAA